MTDLDKQTAAVPPNKGGQVEERIRSTGGGMVCRRVRSVVRRPTRRAMRTANRQRVHQSFHDSSGTAVGRCEAK